MTTLDFRNCKTAKEVRERLVYYIRWICVWIICWVVIYDTDKDLQRALDENRRNLQAMRAALEEKSNLERG